MVERETMCKKIGFISKLKSMLQDISSGNGLNNSKWLWDIVPSDYKGN
jgi:hypothetical protein